uniref:glycoside hydrolase family 43 protein n=1 Tax=Halomonas sp. TaxID=1486246 RepID=UPI0026380390|nr:family 43 glycosylhydrolase [Halomonas sp.]
MPLQPKPLIEQRADPWIIKHLDRYYFIASVPTYDRLEIRAADSISELSCAPATTVWSKPSQGPLSELIWAPELHHHDEEWFIYFAAAPSREIVDGLFQHRMYCISTKADDPCKGPWSEPRRIETPLDSFSLDATTFRHADQLYYLWAQKDPQVPGNSNLYLSAMAAPDTLSGEPICLSKPEYEWEKRGFLVNEGPAVITHGQRIFITYSASATDENYCMGLLWADIGSNLLDPRSWQKSATPVLQSDMTHHIFGPGHNSFTEDESGSTDLLVYHARTYTQIQGDPLWDPNRHTYVKPIRWDDRGFPDFGHAGSDTLLPRQ